MAKSIIEIRKFNRERRARQRAAARAAGVPPITAVNAAIAEATSFAMAAGVNDGDRRVLIDAAMLITAAADILVERHRFNSRHSREGGAKILYPRPEHRWPSYVPSHTGTARVAPNAA